MLCFAGSRIIKTIKLLHSLFCYFLFLPCLDSHMYSANTGPRKEFVMVWLTVYVYFAEIKRSWTFET